MQPSDERALLERARKCDQQALGEIYDRYSSRIYAYILYRVGNAELAEDLTANVFIKMMRAIRRSNAWQSSFSGWLYRIAHNLVVDHFRKADRHKTLPLDERLVAAGDDPVAEVDRVLAGETLAAALERLTEDQQLVVALKFLQGHTNLQIAQMLGKTEGAIKSLQYRALASMRRHLEEESKGTHE